MKKLIKNVKFINKINIFTKLKIKILYKPQNFQDHYDYNTSIYINNNAHNCIWTYWKVNLILKDKNKTINAVK